MQSDASMQDHRVDKQPIQYNFHNPPRNQSEVKIQTPPKNSDFHDIVIWKRTNREANKTEKTTSLTK